MYIFFLFRFFYYILGTDCSLFIKDAYGTLDYTTMPTQKYDTCIIYFPTRESSSTEMPGLLIEMTRLNVPCESGGYMIFNDENILCGKLEDLAMNERIYYFPMHLNTSVIVHKNPLFSINYKLVDYCYNVTMTARNSSILLEPQYDLECFFKIHLPYGNQIELDLYTNFYTKSITSDKITDANVIPRTDNKLNADDIDYEYIDLVSPQYLTTNGRCSGIYIRIDDAKAKNWSHCIDANSSPRRFSFKSSGNSIMVYVSKVIDTDINEMNENEEKLMPSLYIEYNARPILEIVSQCAFGWIAVHQFCISAIEISMSWRDAENECQHRGGHLASIKSEREQKLVDTLLMNRFAF